MHCVTKFHLKDQCEQYVEMPKGAQPMHVDEADGHLCLWAAVDQDEENVKRAIEVYRDGQDIPVEGVDRLYIGSVLRNGIMHHVFERKK
jgi:hypothetical protein